jgi:ABC-type multidrug transport system permease subunit
MLFTGFFANQENIPWFLTPLQYVSIFKYGYQAMFLNEYEDLEIECMTTNNLADTCDPVKEFDSP